MGISLTAGMRSNLVNLQSTAKLMEQTAVRLNTGKKVNSALDDPTSYFTARSHMSRASDLETLKNGMSEGIQTINAANNGIDGIISLIEAAKAKAESAKSADTGSNSDTVNFTITAALTEGGVVTIGGETYTATASDPGGNEFVIGTGDYALQITAMNLAEQINSEVEADGDITATVSGNMITLASAGTTDLDADTVTWAAGDDNKFSETVVTGGDAVGELVAQYATLMSQIDQLKSDSGYKGINLLDNTDTLKVNFEGSNYIDVNGFNGSVSGLGIYATAGNNSDWSTDDLIDADIALMAAAINTLEDEASSLASSLSIVTTRQDFTENMINTLTTGADNLTLADMNEEGANMLMLQTQQALGTNSLSMSAQTAQSVLRLF